MDYIHNILGAERLKIQLVGAGIVSGDSFGIVIYYNRLVAGFFNCSYGVNCGIVKLHALTYSDRARAQHYDFLFVRNLRLVFFLIGRVKVGYIAFKLRSAGVYHFVYRENVGVAPDFVNFLAGHIPKLCDKPVGKAHSFCRPQRVKISLVFTEHFFRADNISYFFKEQHIDLRGVVNKTDVRVASHKLGNCVYAIVRAVCNIGQHLLLGERVEFSDIQVANTRFEGAHGFQQTFLNSSAYAHDLTGSLHLSGKLVVSGGEFVKGETGHLRHHIVKSRLKRRRCVCKHYFVKVHTYCYLCGYPCNGVAAGF